LSVAAETVAAAAPPADRGPQRPLAATSDYLPSTLAAAVAKADAFGIQQCFIERFEVQTFGTIFFAADVASGSHQIRFGGVA